jgi:hypothetical protein
VSAALRGLGIAAVVLAVGAVAAFSVKSDEPKDLDERMRRVERDATFERDLAGLKAKVGTLERRLEELTTSLESARREAVAARNESEERGTALRLELSKEREKADAAAALLSAATGDPRPAGEKKAEDMDAFAREVARGMRQGIRQEFRRVSDLITAPTPEALEARRRQLHLFAQTFGASAGLDQAQTATLERILNDTDEKARDDLRPLLQGTEDYRQVDYKKVRKVTDDSFSAQNDQFDREFPKDKSEKLKQQLEPVRRVFGAMIDELDREAAAPADAPK